MLKKMMAEMLGTFWLVFGGCGSAVLSVGFPEFGIGFAGVALAFGLTVLTMAYALGHISGGHFNPAVTLGQWVGGLFPGKDLVPYIASQVLGGVLAGGVLYVIASGVVGFDATLSGFASNGYSAHSPGGYSLLACALTELVLTIFFVLIINSVVSRPQLSSFAPIAIGLALTLIHLISIPVTGTSVNPARSTGVALFQGGWAIDQLWLFWAAPLLGALLGGLISLTLKDND